MTKNPDLEEVNLLSILKSLISHLRRNFYSYLIICMLSIAGSFIYYLFAPRAFTSNMILYSNNLRIEVISEIFDDINRLIKTKYYEEAADKIGIKIWDMYLISGFNVEMTSEVLHEEVTTQKQLAFKIEVEVADPKVLDLLEERIPQFIEENPFVIRKMESFRISLLANINTIDKEISYLESQKDFYQNLSSKNSSINNSILIDISQLSSTIVELQEKRQYALNLLSDNKSDITVFKGFTKFYKPDRPRLSKILSSGFVIGLVLATLFSFREPFVNFIKSTK